VEEMARKHHTMLLANQLALDVEVIVLAHASMARVVATLEPGSLSVPVCSRAPAREWHGLRRRLHRPPPAPSCHGQAETLERSMNHRGKGSVGEDEAE
jgi:hypothetical protein